jgi:hypothetical protein
MKCEVGCVRVLKVSPGKLLTIQIKNIGGKMKTLTAVLIIIIFFGFTIGAEVNQEKESAEEEKILISKKEYLNDIEKEVKKKMDEQFKGLGFGLGLSLTIHKKRIEEAQLVDGMVRISEETGAEPRLLFESHYFFTPTESKMIGLGPFVCVLAGDNKFIEAIGGGFMVGLRRKKDKSDSFNLGIGIISDTKVKVLGDGIEVDKPLPDGETEIRYKTKNGLGILFILSFTF